MVAACAARNQYTSARIRDSSSKTLWLVLPYHPCLRVLEVVAMELSRQYAVELHRHGAANRKHSSILVQRWSKRLCFGPISQ